MGNADAAARARVDIDMVIAHRNRGNHPQLWRLSQQRIVDAVSTRDQQTTGASGSFAQLYRRQ